MRQILYFSLTYLLTASFSFSQMNDCSDPVFYGCASSAFVFSSVGDDFIDFPTGSISSGCLQTGDNQLIYMILQANSLGVLEWSLQGSGNTGYMDWAIWPYNPNTTCSDLAAGTLAPLACCWNTSGNGFTGMLNPTNPLAVANVGNTQPPITLSPGQTVLLGISNFSGSLDGQNITMTFNNPNLISCSASANNQTICLGGIATVNISTPGLTNPSFQWLETVNVSNPTSGYNVIVTPPSTSTYHVIVSDLTTIPPFVDTAMFTITVVNPPVPNAGVDDTICLGSLIHLNGSISNFTDTYSWNVNTTGIIPNPVVTYTPNSSTLMTEADVNQPGIYKFILSENNLTCGIKTDTVNIFVSNITQIVTKTNPICFGGNDGVIQINSPNAVQYSFDNGVTWGNNPIKNGLSSGVYNVCSKNLENCQICNVVTISDPVIVTLLLSNDTTICQNGTAILSASSTGGTSFVYHWSHTNSTNNLQTINPISNSYYSVFAENENGCTSLIDSIKVSLFDALSGTITPNSTICPGNPISLIANALGGNSIYNYNWSSGQITTGLTSTIQVNPQIATIYKVTITDNCESTPLVLSSTVSLYPIPVPLFTIDQDSICDPAVFTIRNATSVNDFSHLKWNLSDGEVILDQEVISTSPLKEGYYNVKLIVTSPNGCIDSLNKLSCLISMPKPIPNFSFFPNPVKVFNTNVSFSNTTYNSTQFEWFIEGGTPSYSIAENPKTHFPEGIAASYEVKLIATSDFGCIDSSINYVVVLPEVILYAPNCFTPNGDEFNQVWKVTIDGIDVFDYKLEVFNRWGEIIWQTNDPEDFWDGTYNGRKVIDGTYNWMIETKDKFNDEKYRFNGSFNVIK